MKNETSHIENIERDRKKINSIDIKEFKYNVNYHNYEKTSNESIKKSKNSCFSVF